jgi:hypothetical protein
MCACIHIYVCMTYSNMAETGLHISSQSQTHKIAEYEDAIMFSPLWYRPEGYLAGHKPRAKLAGSAFRSHSPSVESVEPRERHTPQHWSSPATSNVIDMST